MHSNLPKLAFSFWERFPGAQAGDCIDFVVNGDHIWKGGRGHKSCDKRLVIDSIYLSRIHFTLYYDRRSLKWLLIDGGVYESEPLPTPSRNGIWLCSPTTTEDKWIRIKGHSELNEGDRLLLAPGLRIIVCQNCETTTMGDFLWEDQLWKFSDAYQLAQRLPIKKKEISTSVQKDLVANAVENPSVSYLIRDWGEWLQSPPRTASEGAYKFAIIAVMLAIAMLALSGLFVWVARPQLILSPPSHETTS